MEMISAAALKVRDKVFTGTTHMGAAVQIIKSMPPEEAAAAILDAEDGFLTTEGRFVDRAEAFELAATAKQLSGTQGLDDPENNKAFYKTARPSLDSGIVESYAPMPVVRP